MIGATWIVRAVITLAVAYWLGQAINQTYQQLAIGVERLQSIQSAFQENE